MSKSFSQHTQLSGTEQQGYTRCQHQGMTKIRTGYGSTQTDRQADIKTDIDKNRQTNTHSSSFNITQILYAKKGGCMISNKKNNGKYKYFQTCII